ncbi:uncharacterized protein TRIVIDRAFT_31507 [Trichoderma virens Gv29-8]|jgi:hypothetical protein|uniref:Myb-like domain-containing protein n=1 Tax=Hypocrea virens (strain Gv29-8 / FGSC 10586) TaxID=413071 RepID=G9MM96_HYPVG|nr:uncharacterized protein TRIVIDRAFT_31507 [Trichoderma virens Gv29-8]EHK24465.1 hypothetical protein TRIVIDRAFT_31507 [Trichoderma virens Gv29-8]UKZ54737.1 hypothetical protein TrVGV298_008549 [Trichoderma virens]
MPAKKTDSSDTPSVNGLRDNELRFIKAVFDNMTQKPDANWAQVATDLGLKDAKCAKERFRQMSVRHGWRSNTQATPGSSPGGKTKKNDVTGPSGDGKVTKKPKARTPKKAVAKKEESEDEDIKDEDDDFKEEEVEDGPFF